MANLWKGGGRRVWKFYQGYKCHRNPFHGKWNILGLVSDRQSFYEKVYIFQNLFGKSLSTPFALLELVDHPCLAGVKKQDLYEKIRNSVWIRIQRKLFVPGGDWKLGMKRQVQVVLSEKIMNVTFLRKCACIFISNKVQR